MEKIWKLLSLKFCFICLQIKIFAEARTEAINIICGLISSSSQCSDGAPACIKLMARIEEKLPSFATSAGQPAQPTHGLVSGPVCVFFDRLHGEPVYGEMVLILIHIVGSYYTGIHRPPLSADWYQQWPKINYLHCVLHKIRTEGDGWKGDHYQIRTGPTDPRKKVCYDVLEKVPSEGS